MNDAQTWTAIGGMLAVFLAFMTLMVRMFGSTMNAKFDAVDARFDGLTMVMAQGFKQVDRRFEQVDRRFEQVDKRFEQVDKRFERLETRVDNLDRDVQAITRRFWDGPNTA
jgi:septal ring factor EnvC (AmiA/AmiB activator)